jgi:hypothetical protein
MTEFDSFKIELELEKTITLKELAETLTDIYVQKS